MLQCPNCSKIQEKGKFCGQCGTQVEEMEQRNTSTETQPNKTQYVHQEKGAQEAIHMEVAATVVPLAKEVGDIKNVAGDSRPVASETDGQSRKNTDIKEEASKFWNTSLIFLKNPSKAFEGTETGFLFGLIQMLLYPATFALAIYFSLNTLVKSTFGMFGDGAGVPFFDVFIFGFFMIALLLAVPALSIFIFEKLFVKQLSLKTLVAQYGALMTPFIYLHMLAIVTGIAGSILLTAGLLGISFLIASFMMAPLFIYEKLSYYRTSEQKVYSSVAVFLVNGLLTYLVVRMIVMEIVGDIVDELTSFTSFF